MRTVTPPRVGVPIGRITFNGNTVDVAAHPEFTRFFESLFWRGGGVTAYPNNLLQPTDQKGVANGYASLGSTALVPSDELGTGTADATTVLYGDGVWRVAGGANVGTATLDFGSHPGSNETSIAITGQTAIAADSTVKAWLSSEASGTHTAADAAYAAAFVGISCTAPTVGVGFTINARSEHKMTGTFAVHYEWK